MQLGPEQPEFWMPTPSEQEQEEGASARGGQVAAMIEVWNSRADHNQSVAAEPAAGTVVDKWLTMHVNKQNVGVGGTRVTKNSKFPGHKPGWVFKTGDQGLGYYRDGGGLRTNLSLDLALHPMRSLPVATIKLDSLVSPATARPPPSKPSASASMAGAWQIAAGAAAAVLAKPHFSICADLASHDFGQPPPPGYLYGNYNGTANQCLHQSVLAPSGGGERGGKGMTIVNQCTLTTTAVEILSLIVIL